MSYHFYAMLSRMKNIYRWGLMRNTKQENLSEHSLEVAFVAHALAVIHNKRLDGNINAEKVALIAMFHDTSEIITGDMPTPIKYYNPEIKAAYKQVEAVAEDKLISYLPDYMKEDISAVYKDVSPETAKLIKAADKISAYIKCIEEIKMGNREFEVAKTVTKNSIHNMECPEAEIFLEDFIESFNLSLDEQN